MAHWTVPSEVLNSNADDAAMLLRIGAGVNAMEASLRHILSLGDTDEAPATQLARVHCVVAAVGYLREIVKTIERERFASRLWGLVDTGITGGVMMSVPREEAESLLSPENEQIGGLVLLKVRDKVGFHWDPQPFAAFVAGQAAEDTTLIEFGGGRKIDRIFRASADAVSRWFLGLAADGDESLTMEQLLPAVVRAQLTLGDVLEAAWTGFVIQAGRDPSEFFRGENHEA
jgi:hypothetical protein